MRIPLSVNNQCDVVIYGLSGSRSPRGVSPVEESTGLQDYSTYYNVAYKLQTIYCQANKSMWCFCDVQYRDSLIPSSSAHKPDMQRDTIDLVRRNDCNSILYKEFKKAYNGLIPFQMLTMTLYSYWKSPFADDNNHLTQHFLTKKQVSVNMARGASRKSRKGWMGRLAV